MKRNRHALIDVLELDIWEEDRATAYHEASHAVLYVLFGVPFTSAEIFNDEHRAKSKEANYAGIVRAEWEFPDWACPWCPDFRFARALRRWEAVICIYLAGELGESIHRGSPAPKCVSKLDRESLDFMELAFDVPMAVYTSSLMPLVINTLRLPIVWEAVRTIAEALLARAVLTHPEVLALAGRTCGPRATVRTFKARARQQAMPVAPRVARLVAAC